MKHHYGAYKIPLYGSSFYADVVCDYEPGLPATRWEPADPIDICRLLILIGDSRLDIDPAEAEEDQWYAALLENIQREIEIDRRE